MRKGKKVIGAALAGCMTASMFLTACGDGNEKSGKTEIEILQYKPEAATYFDQVEEKFNATHDDIHLTIDSPNDASTIMRTRFIRILSELAGISIILIMWMPEFWRMFPTVK